MNAATRIPAPSPALIVVGGGPQGATGTATSADTELARQKLLSALPAARQVLSLGTDTGALRTAYLRAHAQAAWQDTDEAHLDEAAATSYDLIVLDRFEHLQHPARALAQLAQRLAPGGQMVLLARNHTSLSGLARLIEADPSTGTPASADDPDIGSAHPRWQSHSTLYKLLLDADWIPTLVDHVPDTGIDDKVQAAARFIGDALGVPAGCTDQTRRMKDFVVRATRPFAPAPDITGPAVFDVVVPTNKEQQLRVNVEQSPGLRDVGARIISCRGAATPAQAMDDAAPHLQADWVLLCHQDIYFPKGFGARLNALLDSIPPEDRAKTLIGFVGMGVDRQTHQPKPAGFVIDRLTAADYPESDAGISIDELALVVSRDSIHRIDPLIGWHLWATDLCLTAMCTHEVLPRIVKLPLYHNTQSGWHLPEAFFDSAEYILQKHPAFGTVHSLCGTINQGFIAQHRKGPSA